MPEEEEKKIDAMSADEREELAEKKGADFGLGEKPEPHQVRHFTGTRFTPGEFFDLKLDKQSLNPADYITMGGQYFQPVRVFSKCVTCSNLASRCTESKAIC